MTVAATPRRAGPFAGNGVTTVFPFAFKVFDDTDIAIVRTDNNGNAATLVLDSDYSVTLNPDQDANPGGSITYPILVGPVPLPVGWSLTMIGGLLYQQQTDITNAGRFLPQVLEDALDYVTILTQQLKEISNRTLQAAVGATVNLVFPAPSSGKFIRWNSAATGLENADAGTDSMVLQGLLADAANNIHGAGMIGYGGALVYPAGTVGAALAGVNKNVGSIAALRLLPKTGTPNAFVTGYYVPGDGGGGAYYYDAADVVSADNGGTIIVAADGGRWKLTRTTVLSVRQFGAKGDGATDDLAAITAAIAGLGSGNDLYFPAGTYQVSNVVIMNKQARMYGVGTLSVLRTSHSTADILRITSFNNIVENLTFETSVVRTGGFFVNVNNGSRVTLSGLTMTNWFNGIGFTGPVGAFIRVLNCQLGTNVIGGVGIDVSTSTPMIDGVFQNILIGGGVATQPSAGIHIAIAGDLTLNRISTVWCQNGLRVDPGGGNNVQALYVTDSFFDSGSSTGVQLNPTSGSAIQLAKFTNVWSASNANGFVIGAAGTGSVQKSEFINCSGVNNTAGAGLNIASTNNIDVLVVGGNYAANATGLSVVANAQKFKFIGVKSGSSGQFGPNSGFGLVLGANVDFFNIESCDFNNNTSGPIAVGALPATGGQTFFIRGNQGVTTYNSATATLTAGGTTTAINHGLPSTPRIQDITLTPVTGWGTAQAWWVSSVTASQIVVTTNANPGGGVSVGFTARLWGG
ncbi:glycosyl hydrolase family 28-related protein [Variovorax sp. GT1P44]|uniref:glycosyl hydrolase family 28-related protein n=1 Tax=Variovorax sp. GT1P44 TaxID=3443742 RepID=UPI003F45C39A